MKRIWGKALKLVLGIGAFVALTPACADNDRTIFIQAVLAPASSRTNGACVYTGDPTQAIESIGRLDVGVSQSYLAEVLVGNQMIPRGDPNQPRAESNRVHIEGAVVHIADPNGGTIADFTSLSSGLIDVAAGNIPGYAPITVPLTDANTTAALRKALRSRSVSTTIQVTFKVFGTTIGNEDVESGDFTFPIEVCNGCLIDYSAVTMGTACPNATAMDAQASTNPCIAGQDAATPCGLCKGSQTPDLCGDAATNP